MSQFCLWTHFGWFQMGRLIKYMVWFGFDYFIRATRARSLKLGLAPTFNLGAPLLLFAQFFLLPLQHRPSQSTMVENDRRDLLVVVSFFFLLLGNAGREPVCMSREGAHEAAPNGGGGRRASGDGASNVTPIGG